jgi:hypothetical protein
MHKKKEGVILRILAQESLDLEMWLKRYGVLKFRGYFMNFSQARDPSEIIFPNSRGLFAKTMDCRSISKKLRASMQNSRNNRFLDLFLN